MGQFYLGEIIKHIFDFGNVPNITNHAHVKNSETSLEFTQILPATFREKQYGNKEETVFSQAKYNSEQTSILPPAKIHDHTVIIK